MYFLWQGDLSRNLSEKVEVVKNEFWNSVDANSFKDLYVIDVMQRLNIDHHFQEEIEAFLGKQYLNCSTVRSGYGDDIHETALLFRLLRQQGYFVPAGTGSTKLYISTCLIFQPILPTLTLIFYSIMIFSYCYYFIII